MGSSKSRGGEYFSKTVELSIFVDANKKSDGVGSRLYSTLLEILRSEEIHCVVAGIALPNDASIAILKKFGFEDVGVFKEYAVKGGKFYSSMWLQKIL